MYTATLSETNQEVIVKFTARYNEVAHRLLAKARLAPKLHFCEYGWRPIHGHYGPCGWEVHLAAPKGQNTSSCHCLEEGQGGGGSPS